MERRDVTATPNTHHTKRAVGIFKKQEHVEHAIRALKDNHFDMSRVSLLARNVEDVAGSREINETHGNEASEGAGIGATTGTVLGGVTGFLIGVGVLAIPGVGPILAAGAEISALGSTLAGAGVGAATGGIVGALIGLGIPEEKAKVYEDRIKAGDYLLMVSGDDDTMRRTESIMGNHHVDDFEVFATPNKTSPAERINHRSTDTAVSTGGQNVPTTQGTHGRRVNNPPATTGEVSNTSPRGQVNHHSSEVVTNKDENPEVIVVDKRTPGSRRHPTR